MSNATLTSARAISLPMKWLLQLRAWLEAVPYSVLALPLRFGVAWIFWSSAQVKLLNWQRTIEFFTDEYRVPILSPELAASMALAVEIACPILLVLGLFTRFTVVVLMAMTLVIQIFVYPEAWPTHLQWFAMMLVLLCRGAGTLSADHLLWRWFRPKLGA
ncbi:MAG: DoxX family protein [Betaproteobacteria bacterium]|nr:DoxX family protein [Betaproteobacteria bacterium]